MDIPVLSNPGQATLDKLPTELKVRIATFVAADDYDDGSPYRADLSSFCNKGLGDHNAFNGNEQVKNRCRRQRYVINRAYKAAGEREGWLVNLAKTSKKLSEAAKYVLYRDLVIDGQRKMLALLFSLTQFPANRSLVRSLQLTGIEWSPPQGKKPKGSVLYPIKHLIALLQCTPKLNRLAIEVPADWKLGATGLSAVDRPPKIADFVNTIHAFNRHKKLCESLSEISLMLTPGYVLDPLNFAPLFSLGQITKLEIAGTNFAHQNNGRQVTQLAPTALANITELSLKGNLGGEAGYTGLMDMFSHIGLGANNNIRVIRVGPDFDRNFRDHTLVNNWNAILPTQAANLETFDLEPVECDDRCEDIGCRQINHARRRFGPDGRLTCLPQMTSLTTLKIPFAALFGCHVESFTHYIARDAFRTLKTVSLIELPPNLETLHLIEEHETKYSVLRVSERLKIRKSDDRQSMDHLDVCHMADSSFLPLQKLANRCVAGQFPSLVRVHLEPRKCRWATWDRHDLGRLERLFARGGVTFSHDPIPTREQLGYMLCRRD